MPLLYQKLGVCFQYPDNWVLDEKDALAGENSVSVYSPGGAFWSVVIHASDVRPESLLQAALKAMQQEYSDLDFETARELVAGHELAGYDLNFYCLDLTNTALLRVLCTSQNNCLLLCQADDAEFKLVEPVFAAITASLVSAFGAPEIAAAPPGKIFASAKDLFSSRGRRLPE